MNKCALYIPRPGYSYRFIRQGYVDALTELGWKVYVHDPKTKLCCTKLIEDYGVRLIFTHSRYGIRQLPIDVINKNNVVVMVNSLPLNPHELTIDDPYEKAHNDEPDIVRDINRVVVHTCIEPHLWPDYFNGWTNTGINIVHIPVAGNLVRAVPPTCSILTDVAMVANFGHRQDIMKQFIEPLFKRLDLLEYSYQAFGDDIWARAGLNHNGPLSPDCNRLAHIYATAKVCPNVHTERQVALQAYVNERSFMITLCGGVQVSDNSLVTRYIEQCTTAHSVTDFITKVIALVENPVNHREQLMPAVENVANNHTYFNRLVDLFHCTGMLGFAAQAEEEGNRAAIRHCWEIEVRLDAKERNVIYEQETILGS